jgi:alanine-synthesizing transaminase
MLGRGNPASGPSMGFSLRTGWNTEPSELARALDRRRQAGLPIADLTVSNPTRCGFVYPKQWLEALADGRALDYDPQPKGSLPAREAISAYYASHRVGVDPDQIVLTTSTSEAYSFLFHLLCDPGDGVLITQPGYPLFDFLAALCDVRLQAAPLVYDQGWQIEIETMRRAITPRTRAIILVHPNNPTGHFTKPWEVEEVARLCRTHSLALIVDEVFLDYSWGENQPSFAAGLDGVEVFAVSGLSKIAGLPQMKAAWIVAAGRGVEQTAALDRLEVIADTFLSVNTPVQCALPAWLRDRTAIEAQIRARVVTNLAALDSQLKDFPAARRLALEGGWYATLRIPAVAPDERTILALIERGVFLHPGFFFGLPESGWLVLSLLPEAGEFQAGVANCVDYLSRNQGSNRVEV